MGHIQQHNQFNWTFQEAMVPSPAMRASNDAPQMGGPQIGMEILEEIKEIRAA